MNWYEQARAHRCLYHKINHYFHSKNFFILIACNNLPSLCLQKYWFIIWNNSRVNLPRRLNVWSACILICAVTSTGYNGVWIAKPRIIITYLITIKSYKLSYIIWSIWARNMLYVEFGKTSDCCVTLEVQKIYLISVFSVLFLSNLILILAAKRIKAVVKGNFCFFWTKSDNIIARDPHLPGKAVTCMMTP